MTTAISVLRDRDGYLINPEDWDETIAREFAAGERLQLTDEHWRVINFMRKFWTEQRIAPDVRHVVAFLHENHGFDKRAAKAHLFTLFPNGYTQQGVKIAGMQRPRAWSSG